MTDDIKRATPVGETGELRRRTGVAIVAASARQVRAEAIADTDYAAFVIEGTLFHQIRPKKPGGVLAFKWPARGPGTFFFAKVNHPGNDANPFFERIVRRWQQYLRSSA
jgi:hypothetical protein